MNYKGNRHLQWEDRLTIERMLKIKTPKIKIAEALNVCLKTIYNEISRGMCEQLTREYEFVQRYCAEVAERKYQTNLRAKGPEIKLGKDYAFADYIEDQIINKKRSPGAALAQAAIDATQFDTQICEKTLYNWIYKGDVFLSLTEEHLLYKGKNKSINPDQQNRAYLSKGTSIEKRPQEIAERNTFGHWEMDSVVGCKGCSSTLIVLTERLTRYPVVAWFPDHTMQSVVRVLDRLEQKLGAGFRKIYYCHPSAASERGSNENMNRIIRRFFPKGTNFDYVSSAEIAEVESWLANYPRRILGWKTPQMLFDRYIS